MVQTIMFDTSLLNSHLVVDVRSPLEFAEDHLPGALNIPLLNNEERVEIGTIHRQYGPKPARLRGLELTAARFPVMVNSIAGAAEGRPILVTCWRGGLRSKTVATLLDLVGLKAVQLTGGYKGFRAAVNSYFQPFHPPGPLVVLHGLTGSGKTLLLKRLAVEGLPVLDLEGLAQHRGSAFGELGLQQNLSQKRFESLIWTAFQQMPAGTPIIVEGESRRIGKVYLPGNLYEVMAAGTKIWCHVSIQTRINRLIEEYGKPEYAAGMLSALSRIRKKLGGDRYNELAAHLEQWHLEPFMEGLMLHYYDRTYYSSKACQEDARICLEDMDAAVSELRGILADRFMN